MILKEQRLIIWGTVLGDGYLQKTGKKNARLKIEHSEKQKEYIFWKYNKLINMAQDKPKLIKRFNQRFKKEYSYYRFQTHSSPILGKYKSWFYDENGRKKVPKNIKNILKYPLVLAVWYMDDGYLDKKNHTAEIYLPKYSEKDVFRLKKTIEELYSIKVLIKYKKGFPVIVIKDLKKFFSVIRDYIVDSMRYKISFGPVTTGGVFAEGSGQ